MYPSSSAATLLGAVSAVVEKQQITILRALVEPLQPLQDYLLVRPFALVLVLVEHHDVLKRKLKGLSPGCQGGVEGQSSPINIYFRAYLKRPGSLESNHVLELEAILLHKDLLHVVHVVDASMQLGTRVAIVQSCSGAPLPYTALRSRA